jgi:hypothetical protein
MITGAGEQSTGAGVGTTIVIPPLPFGLGVELGPGLALELGLGLGLALALALGVWFELGPGLDVGFGRGLGGGSAMGAYETLPAQPERSTVSASATTICNDTVRARPKRAALAFEPSTRTPLSASKQGRPQDESPA